MPRSQSYDLRPVKRMHSTAAHV